MYTRDHFAVPIVWRKSTSAAGATAQSVGVDMAPYFPVGRRSVKFLVSYIAATTVADETVKLTLQECATLTSEASTSTSPTNILLTDGTTATWTSTAAASSGFEIEAVLNYRYVNVGYNNASTSSGGSYSIIVAALPIVRAA